jgi:hypothetical protein
MAGPILLDPGASQHLCSQQDLLRVGIGFRLLGGRVEVLGRVKRHFCTGVITPAMSRCRGCSPTCSRSTTESPIIPFSALGVPTTLIGD